MAVNSEGIYNSKTIAPFKENNICMTQQDDGTSYFFYLAEEGQAQLPKEISIKSHQPAAGASVSLLGSKRKLRWSKDGDGFKVTIPESIRNNPPCDHAWTVKVSALK
jgi:alpha-L-fucosidase